MLYHVMSRGNAQQPIFTNDGEYHQYLRILGSVTQRFGVACSAFCLMRTHVHLLLQPRDEPLSRLMQQVNSTYCQWFNRQHDRVGHVMAGRFKALLVDSDTYFLRALRYIVRNPVAARYVQAPGDWEWSSYRASAGLSTAPSFLDLERVRRAFDATDAVSAQQRFVTFAAVSNDADVSNQVLLIGSEAFAKRCAPHLQRYRDVADFVYAERFAARPALGQLLSRSDRSRERDRAVRTAFCEYAYTLREIGAYLERPIPTIWFWIQRAERARHEGELLKGLTNSVN
jgi:REP-associated tyrosine transposase